MDVDWKVHPPLTPGWAHRATIEVIPNEDRPSEKDELVLLTFIRTRTSSWYLLPPPPWYLRQAPLSPVDDCLPPHVRPPGTGAQPIP